jgi:methylated-DNA-protein-cysteine methyltransferase-like protein
VSTPAQRIAAAVAQIPHGQVRSYAQVAVAAGLPGHARQVARVLSASDGQLPWHRVLRADGRIAFAPGSAQAGEQTARLRGEGVAVLDGRVGRAWRPVRALDALLWGGDHNAPV